MSRLLSLELAWELLFLEQLLSGERRPLEELAQPSSLEPVCSMMEWAVLELSTQQELPSLELKRKQKERHQDQS